MADEDLTPADRDPLLVRPYISTDPAPTGTTWPSAAEATALIPVQPSPPPGAAAEPPPPPPSPPRGHRRLLLLAGGAVLVLGLGATGVLALHPHDTPAAQNGAWPTGSLPATVTTSPSAGVAPTTSTGARAAPPAVLPPATTTTPGSPTPTTAATATATTRSAATRTTAAAPSTSPAGGTVSVAPAVARSGALVGAGSLCLDLNGGVPVDGNHVQVFTCNGTDAQRWTVATDGTLRVVGKCAAPVADGTVHITGCGGGSAGQWRQGKSRSLVNVGTGQCLTDPRGGAQSGSGVQVSACTGAAGQQWTLP